MAISLLPALIITATAGVFAVDQFVEAIPGLGGPNADVLTLKKWGLLIVSLVSLSLSVDLYGALKRWVNRALNAA